MTKQISRAGGWRATVVAAAFGIASRESLRNFTGKTHRRITAPMQFASFGVSFRALSGASRDASEEVSVFRPADVWKGAQAPGNTRVSEASLLLPQWTRNRNVKMQVEQIEGCDSNQADILSRIGTLITEVRQKIESQCSLKAMALFLMAEKVDGRKASVNVIESPRKDGEIQVTTEYPSLDEKRLWNLFMGREIAGDHSVRSDKLVEYFNSLVACKSPFLGLMLWLFPELVTEDRVTAVANIERECLGTWMLGDRMLFWLACIHPDSNCKPETIRWLETTICGLQLDSGGFASVEGKDANADLVSSAIGLLVLVSCARRDDSEDTSAVEAAQKTAQWILNNLTVPQIVDASSAWGLYALSEYTTFLNWLELNRARSMVIER